MNRSLLLSLFLCGAATAALAQAPMATQPSINPPQLGPTRDVATLDQPTDSMVEAARWGREVLARANGQQPTTDGPNIEQASDTPKGCVRNPDRSVHGAVSVDVGTGGYRHADIFATAPAGDCGQISVGISKSEGGYRRRGGYR